MTGGLIAGIWISSESRGFHNAVSAQIDSLIGSRYQTTTTVFLKSNRHLVACQTENWQQRQSRAGRSWLIHYWRSATIFRHGLLEKEHPDICNQQVFPKLRVCSHVRAKSLFYWVAEWWSHSEQGWISPDLLPLLIQSFLPPLVQATTSLHSFSSKSVTPLLPSTLWFLPEEQWQCSARIKSYRTMTPYHWSHRSVATKSPCFCYFPK